MHLKLVLKKNSFSHTILLNNSCSSRNKMSARGSHHVCQLRNGMRGTAVFFFFFFFTSHSLSRKKEKKRKEKKLNPLKGKKMGGTNAMFSESSPITTLN